MIVIRHLMEAKLKRPLTRAEYLQACAIEIIGRVSKGATFAFAANELGITTATSVEYVRCIVEKASEESRWGWNADVQAILKKPLLQLFVDHHELVQSMVANFRKEMYSGSLACWTTAPAKLSSTPRLKNRKPPSSVVWTKKMESKLGKNTDALIAAELSLTYNLVQKRRLKLGIPSFRSATYKDQTASKSESETANEISSSPVWSVWSRAPAAHEHSAPH